MLLVNLPDLEKFTILYPMSLRVLLPKILLIVFSFSACGIGLIILLRQASAHSLWLILGAALFLFGSWSAAAMLDGLAKSKSST
jgi:hypothetical protein